MARSYILSGIILASLFQAVFLNEYNKCPHIKVQKDQIIRTKESLENGAKYLAKISVYSARECHSVCCKQDKCNLAMLSYKNDSYGQLVRTCYLFDCGQPSRCTFSPYKRYAIITIEDRKDDNKPTRNEDNQENEDTELTKPGGDRWEEDCPSDAPVAMCYSNPCDTATCPSHPLAVCKPSTCGRCHAVFVDDDGVKVNCYSNRKKTKPLHSTTGKWAESLLKEIDRLHHKNVHSHPTHHENTDLESGLNHIQTQKQTSHQSTSTSTDDYKEETNPPFHQWREFIDNNPKYGKPKLVTERPTPKPTTFHHWREFIDNNPKYAKHYPVKKTTTTTTTVKPKTKAPTTKKPITKQHIIPKTTPISDVKPLGSSPPKVIDDGNRSSNISDVVVIETRNLRIVENRAVVPLAIFLVVSLVLLFVVVLRLRVMKSRIRRKAFATDDADYLINGMYL